RAAYAYTGTTTETGHQLTWTTANGGRPQIGKKTHLVLTTDAETRRGVLYVDGVPVAQSTTFTNSPATVGPTVNDWLARSQFNDPYWYGSIDEFRIWSNALTTFQVAVNAAAGPDTVVADPGALESVSVVAATRMEVGAIQNAGLLADFANVNDVNVTASGTTFSSSDTNVLTVNAAGLMTAVGVGTAEVTASFGGQNDSETITVAAPAPPVLTHRYSFTANANDSVGSAHGTNPQGTMAFNGAARFDGANSLQLPAGVIGNAGGVTVEAWMYASNLSFGGPAYLFSFGETLPSGAAANFLRLAAHDGNAAPVIQSAINGAVINSGQPVGGVTQAAGWGGLLWGDTHLVAVFDAARRQQQLYRNGQLVQSITATIPLSSVNNALSYIGQSLATTETVLLEGALDEFRIYNGALNLEQVRTSLAAGPDNPQLSAGVYTSVQLEAPATLIQGTRRLPSVTGSSVTVANVDLAQVATLSSSNPNVLSVMTDGRISAVNPGVATLTAKMGSASASQQVRVVAPQTALMHRYSFDGGPNGLGDSVAGADAQAWGHAGTNGTGGVVLDGTPGTYVDLPRYLVDGYSAITVETWAAVLPTGNWTRVFDFGNFSSAARPGGTDYIFFAPRTGGASYRVAINPAGAGEQGTTAGTADLTDGVKRHIVCVFQTDPAQPRFAAVYLDGVNVISNATITASLAGIRNDWNFIGRSVYSADSYLAGVIDEFRLYYGALTPEQVAANFAAGPDGAPAVGPLLVPVLNVTRSGANVIVTWSDSLSGFTLKSSAQLEAGAVWNPVTAPPPSGGLYTVTVPITGGAQFFRLEK
ncbi:MAG: hypothetical protein HY674_22865, partial [Chloroflexi bacterium]|nr:hypothetical protein [Chloroflexota bacterium]